jgi:hypothetical protein
MKLAQKKVLTKVGDYLSFDSFACSKATGLLYCNVEWNRSGL